MQKNYLLLNYHLLDCSETVYSTSVTVAPFRRCDLRNLGVSHLCDLASPTLPQPRIWGHQVIQEYKETHNDLPDYIKNGVIITFLVVPIFIIISKKGSIVIRNFYVKI